MLPEQINRVLLFFLVIFGLGACSAPGKASQAIDSRPDLAPVATLPVRIAATSLSNSTPFAATPAPTETPDPPTPAPSPTAPACWKEGGQIEEASLRTGLLSQPLEVRVYLPPCYDQEPERFYPALYLIHGQYYDHNQWDRLGADEMADGLIGSGEIPPFLIVMPRDRLWKQPARDPFGQAVVEVLIPWIDATYRTRLERENRAVGGLSRGASWAVHLGLSQWELFGVLGAHSLPVFLDDAPRLRTWLDAIPAESRPRIFLDIGEQDRLIHSTVEFENLLDEKGIAHEWYLFPGYHEEAYWRAHLEQYLRWYAAEW